MAWRLRYWPVVLGLVFVAASVSSTSEVTSSVGGTDLLDHLEQASGLSPKVSTLTKADVQYAQDSIGSPVSDAASKIAEIPTEIPTDAVATSKKGPAEEDLGEKNGVEWGSRRRRRRRRRRRGGGMFARLRAHRLRMLRARQHRARIHRAPMASRPCLA